MYQWFRFILSGIVCFTLLSCNNKNTNHNSDKDLSSVDSQQRDVASVRKKKVIRKGFYISNKSLSQGSAHTRLIYHLAFANFLAEVENDVFKKKPKKYSQNFDIYELFRGSLLPHADAALCIEAAWVMTNNRGENVYTECTKSNWTYFPEESEDWDRYKSEDELIKTNCSAADKSTCPLICSSNGAKTCPLLGLPKANSGVSHAICTIPGESTSGSCTAQFANGGAARLAQARNECKNPKIARPLGIRNFTCAALEKSFQNSVRMVKEGCDLARKTPRKTSHGLIIGYCNKLEAAIDEVEGRLKQKESDKPKIPSTDACDYLTEKIEKEHLPDHYGESSPEWRSMLRFAGDQCGRLKGKSNARLSAIFGRCERSLPTSGVVDFNALVDNYARAKGDKVRKNNLNFSRTFGIHPSHFKKLFCGESGPHAGDNITAFRGRIRDELAVAVSQTKALVAESLKFSDLKPPLPAGMDALSFARHKNLLEENSKHIDNNVNLRDRAKVEEASRYSENKVWANELFNDLESGKVRKAIANRKFTLEQIIAGFFNKRKKPGQTITREKKLGVRRALSKLLMDKIVPDEHRKQINQAAEWLNGCGDDVFDLKSVGITKAQSGEDGAIHGTQEISNGTGCGYYHAHDVSDLIVLKKEHPALLVNQKENECYDYRFPEPPHDKIDEEDGDGNVTSYTAIVPVHLGKNMTSAADDLEGGRMALISSNFNVKGNRLGSEADLTMLYWYCTEDRKGTKSVEDLLAEPSGEPSAG